MLLKNALLAFSIILFAACNNATEIEKATNITKVETHEVDTVSGHIEYANTLSLRNGAKWQTDESTRTHAAQLNTQVTVFNEKENLDLPAYHSFAADMQKELNGLTNDCKMKGPEHEALHVWLEPVLKEVNNIKTATTLENAKQATEKLTENVQKFNQYFD